MYGSHYSESAENRSVAVTFMFRSMWARAAENTIQGRQRRSGLVE